MEPGNGSSSAANNVSDEMLAEWNKSLQADIDPYQLGQKVKKVDQKRNVPMPKKTNAMGKFRFHSAYLTDVVDDDVRLCSTPLSVILIPLYSLKTRLTSLNRNHRVARKHRHLHRPATSEAENIKKSHFKKAQVPSRYETDEEAELNRYVAWITNKKHDYNKSKQLLFDDKIRRKKNNW